jgi:hypothetical protein
MRFHGDLDGGFGNPVALSEALELSDPRTQRNSRRSVENPNDYTNIFGEPRNKSDYFVGVNKTGCRSTPDIDATKALIDKLSRRMARKTNWGSSISVNKNIPAGYTYFGQLVAHDLVQSSAPFSGLGQISNPQRDFRNTRLVLDTIYGGGPRVTPLAYEIPSPLIDDRVSLRLGRTTAPLRGDLGPARDLPRGGGCPFSNGRESTKRYRRDVYIADPRNDDNFFLSQLVTLFHILHNLIYQILTDSRFDHHFSGLNHPELKRFSFTRRIVALVFRSIVVDDFLKRLLNEDVWKLYSSGKLQGGTLDSRSDDRMPVEFSHAAFRLGHAMVLDEYKVNEILQTGEMMGGTNVGHMRLFGALHASSSRYLDLVPIKSSWLISWSNFFDIPGESPAQSSRRISPSMAGDLHGERSTFFQSADGNGTGLIYRDLIRGTKSGLRSVNSLAECLEALLGPVDADLLKRYESDCKRKMSPQALGTWLNAEADISFCGKEISTIHGDPPLFFHLLFEAFKLESGFGWGFLSSVITAEVIFSSLNQTKRYIEDDAEVNELAAASFGRPYPNSMPQLIEWMSVKLKGNADFERDGKRDIPSFI